MFVDAHVTDWTSKPPWTSPVCYSDCGIRWMPRYAYLATLLRDPPFFHDSAVVRRACEIYCFHRALAHTVTVAYLSRLASSSIIRSTRKISLHTIIALAFWATVCKTVRRMLSNRVLSVLSVLSVTFLYCGQAVGWINMKLCKEVGLGPGHNVLDGDPALQEKETRTHQEMR